MKRIIKQVVVEKLAVYMILEANTGLNEINVTDSYGELKLFLHAEFKKRRMKPQNINTYISQARKLVKVCKYHNPRVKEDKINKNHILADLNSVPSSLFYEYEKESNHFVKCLFINRFSHDFKIDWHGTKNVI